jgi:hypothetical protein
MTCRQIPNLLANPALNALTETGRELANPNPSERRAF